MRARLTGFIPCYYGLLKSPPVFLTSGQGGGHQCPDGGHGSMSLTTASQTNELSVGPAPADQRPQSPAPCTPRQPFPGHSCLVSPGSGRGSDAYN